MDVSSRRRAEYSSDASLYRVPPAAVVFPRDAEEVAAALAVCRAEGVPLTARGAGTSIAGNAVGPGVVLDFSRHYGRVLSVDPETRTAEVEPGAVLDALQRRAARHGLRFGPDPSTHSRCTIGGMIGNNACGSRALAYGRTADNLLALDVLTGAGERITAGRGADASPTLAALRRVVHANLAVIRTELGRFPRQISGYSLEHLLPEHGFDVARAMAGTEGTWGVLLGARVRLVEAPARTMLVVLGYPDMAAAADAVPALLPHRPVALEGIDSRIVDVVRRNRGPHAVPPLPRGGGWLLAELGGESAAELRPRAEALAADAGAGDHLVIDDPAQAAAVWRIREDGAGLAARTPAGAPAHAGWEDAAVPPERLGAYLRAFEELMAGYGLTGLPYGHFGDGCVHVRIDFPFARPGGAETFRGFLLDAARLVAAHGGSMSGEHGDGRARGELLPLMYSPAALSAFAAAKAVFDPDDVLNPGVIVRPAPLDAALRLQPPPPRATGTAFRYPEDGGDLTAAVHRCTGVAKCRSGTAGSGVVMCPSYLATRDERDSTRGRARVLQEAVRGALPGGLRAPEVRDVLDLCLSCKGCRSDCPTGVDMATYKAEVLHQTYRRRPRPVSHYTLGWLPRWARLAGAAPRAANALLHAPVLGGLAKRMGGIDPRRELPSFAERPFSRHRPPRAATPGTGPRVLLWVDTFTGRFSPGVAQAAIRVLQRAGHTVAVPRASLCCGLTWISTGQLDAARRRLRRTVAALARHAAEGMPIVALEPSCAAVLRADALDLLGPDHPDAAAVARSVRTLAEFLTALPDWTPPDLSGTKVLAQPHCHHHAVIGWHTDRALLTRAGAEVSSVGGCCGLAGNFGVERGHYDVSVAVAETQLLPAVREAADGTVLLADGFSCRTQLAQLAHTRARHLAELMAEAGDTAEAKSGEAGH
ncbi:FAD/FMN-containing dehydrogenase/Fe-S oxidoreductase [Thermocatellispora tengchongensis]|uniref:FAD/FMN-containing dehydrogenase/Fe-S oxidoreductase n=1 Tax=Thermocatellispora tengchongensis TaxID=1073253 RepID=A0A840NY47_9ACTN|nr:FAD-binding and (Fe-S)-binding domain-containing protein [Thermocatellispora tengchongensis]MBB5132112.1 FAD/FMN-containing dehydrogenase/Fe-S oxidoreductase [Thermocatellispora tengchongensis]